MKIIIAMGCNTGRLRLLLMRIASRNMGITTTTESCSNELRQGKTLLTKEAILLKAVKRVDTTSYLKNIEPHKFQGKPLRNYKK
ncbi:MAG TPA: hypothetical protein VF680_16965 [Allosphingosinicella sp.]|jgi:hypothetical protein